MHINAIMVPTGVNSKVLDCSTVKHTFSYKALVLFSSDKIIQTIQTGFELLLHGVESKQLNVL